MYKRAGCSAFISAIVCVVVSGYAVQAQNNGVASNATDGVQIVVAASPISAYESFLLDGANNVAIGRRQLERLSATDLPTALRQIPGVSISRYSPVGAYGGGQGGSIYIRGSGTARPGSEIKIYTEGVPRESGVWSHPLMDIAPITFAEEVTVAKNPQPQNYPGTFGAVDMTLRRRSVPGHEGELSLAYGRFNTALGSVSVGGKEGLFDYYIGVAGSCSDGARSHNEAELWNLYLRAGWELTPEDHLAYIFQYTDNQVQDPGPKGGITPQRDRFDTRTDTHVLRLESTREWISGYALVYFENGKIRWHKDHLSDGVLMSPPGQSNTDWRNYGFRSSYDLAFDLLILTASFDSWSEGGETRNIRERDGKRVFGYDGRLVTTAPYLGARTTWDVGQTWTLTPSGGMRYYHNSSYDDAWAPCAAVTLANEEVAFFLSHARGVHYPGVYARGTSPQTWRQLDAETLDTTEAGIHLEIGALAEVHASVYHASAKNRMDMTENGFLNVGGLRSDGLELTTHFHPHQDLTLFVGGAYAHAHTRPASRLPELTVSLGASYHVTQDLRWDVDCEYVASQYAYSMRTPDPTLDKLDSFFVLNTRLSLALRALGIPSALDGEIYLALENVTDSNYAYFSGYPMPGIATYAGLKVRF